MTRIALLDYGMGNLHSAAKALEHVGATVDVTNDPKLVAQADKIVFPGVGAMRDCMQGMHEAGIDEVVRHAAFNKPVLAICVGMQALMQRSEENGGVDALGIFEGSVKRFPDVGGLKVPHMGWNQVHQADPSHPMWKDIEPSQANQGAYDGYSRCYILQRPSWTHIGPLQSHQGLRCCSQIRSGKMLPWSSVRGHCGSIGQM